MSDDHRNVTIDRSEISLAKAGIILVAILTASWGVVSTIVIPVSNLTLQVTQLTTTVSTYIKNQTAAFTILQNQVTTNSTDITIIKQKLNLP